MSTEVLEELPLDTDTDTNGSTKLDTMAHNQESVPSNVEIMDALKELRLESIKQNKALDSRLKSISADVSFIKKELMRHSRTGNSEADNRLANLTLHELQTFCQLVVPAIDIGEDFINDAEDPDDVYLNIYFHGEEDLLSTFYPVELSLDGKLFKSAEHLYQYKKAEFHGELSIGEEILNASTGRGAKAIGKRNIQVSTQWDAQKEDVMEDVLQVKAMQCREFRERLLLTGSRRLIHDLPDPFWGWGKDGWGKNTMGLALERIRSDLEDRSSSVFMDDDIAQVHSPHTLSPTEAKDEFGYTPDHHSHNSKTNEDEPLDNATRTGDDSHSSSHHRKKNKRNNRDRKNDPVHGHSDANDDANDNSSCQREGSTENPGRTVHGRGRSERSVWSEGSGSSIQVKIPSKNIDDAQEGNNPGHMEHMREPRRGGRRNRRKSPNSRHSDYHGEDEKGILDGHEDRNANDRERQDSRRRHYYGGQENERFARSREDSGSSQQDDYRSGQRQWSGQRHRGGYEKRGNHYNSGRSYHPRRPRRGRGQNYFNRDRGTGRKTSESDSHASHQNARYEGRMYSDYAHEAGEGYNEQYNADHIAEGLNRSGGFSNNPPQGFNHWHQHAVGRGADYYSHTQRGHYANQHRRGGGGAQRHGGPRQVEFGSGGDQCQVTVENSGRDGNPDAIHVEENVNQGNPQGHPEGSSHL